MLDYNVDFSQAMPATFSSLVFEMCKHFQVDASLIVPTVLSVSSSLVHDKFKVQICDPVTHGTFQEPLSLFTIGLAESSARKSPVMKLLKAPIQSVLAEQNEVIKAQQYEQKAQKKLSKASMRKLQKEIDKLPPESPQRKVLKLKYIDEEKIQSEPLIELRRLFLQDSTYIAAADFMESQEGNACTIMDAEGIAFDSISTDHRFLELMLSGFSNEEISAERSSRSSIDIASPHAGLCILTQPFKMQKLAKSISLWDEGFIPRSLIFFCPDLAGWRAAGIGEAIPQKHLDWWESKCRAFLSFPHKFGVAGKREYYTLHLSHEASHIWRDFSKQVERMMRMDRSTFPLRSWLGKMAGVSARIASIYHLFESHLNIEETINIPISSLHMQQACGLIESLVPHMLQAHEIFFPADNSVGDAIDKIVDWLKQEDGTIMFFKRRDLYRKFGEKSKTVEYACTHLVHYGILEPRITYSNSPGRRGTPIYDVNYRELYRQYPLRQY